jgi:5-oxoprolinase (ATP-hydrolysing)
MPHQKKFRFSIDRGGTFTDIYAEVPGENKFRVAKLLSQDPHNYADAPTEGIRRVLCDVLGESFDLKSFDTKGIEWIRMGTTIATNALLERNGARCALLVTKGFKDILRIGDQDRAHIFDLRIAKPDLLYEEVIEVDERIVLTQNQRILPPHVKVIQGITGEGIYIEKSLDVKALKPALQNVLDNGIDSIAVVLMHAYIYPEHELAIGKLAEELGFAQISLSSQVTPVARLVARGDTAMVDAYLNPRIKSYLKTFQNGFSDQLKETRLLFMQSDGGLAPPHDFTGSRAILSGPAGGVVGYALTTINHEKNRPVIGFDMGGTSTDVSRYGGKYELTFETQIAGVRIKAPQLHIKTVAAGGGSRLFFDNGMFLVGPESSGAHPGPVCYRKNGYLSITDANLILGRLQPKYFPNIFGPKENQPLDLAASKTAMSKLTEKINLYYKKRDIPPLSVEQAALGYIRVANEVMIRPIKEISVIRGFDIKKHILATFGGAGAQHACAIARGLGLSNIFIHRFSGILSAYGIGLADVVVERQCPCAGEYNKANLKSLLNQMAAIEASAVDELLLQEFSQDAIQTTRYLNMRYDGTDTAMMIAEPSDQDFATVFERNYRREFGFNLKDRSIIVDDIRVNARGKSSSIKRIKIERADSPPKKIDTKPCFFDHGWEDIDIYDCEGLKAGHVIKGPGIILQNTATILVEPGCTASITPFGDVEIKVGQPVNSAYGTKVDPISLSIFSNLFISVAEQMGRMLQKTSISTNIKERLDFSCALFSSCGDLVANAPHLPVHLGAMSSAVKEQIRRREKNLKPGDVLVTNHPMEGGSHLPDITVITPVFYQDKIIFWVAARGHHTDIGGISPGSMPPNSKTLKEEGACITSFKLVQNNIFQEEEITKILLAPERIVSDPGRPDISGARLPADNISDLKAQVAANQKGIQLILQMVADYGLDVVQAYMKHVQDAAKEAVRMRLKSLSASKNLALVDSVTAVDYLDDGSPIALKLTIDRARGSVVFDFNGTGPEIWGNLNAPKAVTKSAVLYSLRCLIQKDLPLNDGSLLPVTIHIPSGSLLDPSPYAAVVGGNVLTSQRIVDVILKAFGVVAASQGCMNNFTFGNERFGYYETIGGGAGAGPTWHGQSGVHTHMTNTRITDPEILERRYPVLLREFSIRKGSGGKGRHHGGDGLIREVEFLDDLSVAVLSERRVHAPYGLYGGKSGKRGKNIFIRKDGHRLYLGGKNEIRACRGDRIRILTPGGGGFGKPLD